MDSATNANDATAEPTAAADAPLNLSDAQKDAILARARQLRAEQEPKAVTIRVARGIVERHTVVTCVIPSCTAAWGLHASVSNEQTATLLRQAGWSHRAPPGELRRWHCPQHRRKGIGEQ